MSNLVIFGSNPATATGGASAVIQSYIDFIRRRFPRVKLSYVFYHDCVYDNAILRYKKMFAPFFWLLQNISSKKTWICWWHSTGLIDAIILFVMGMISPKTHSFIVTLHSPLYKAPQKSPSLRYRVYRFLVASSGSTIHYLNNFFQENWLRDHRLFVSPIKNPMVQFPNPISNQILELLSNEVTSIPPITGERLRIGSMCRLIPGKGVGLLIESLKYNECDLVVAGDGPERKNLESLVEHLDLKHRVEFVGHLKGQDKALFLQSIDIFCVPSRYDTQSLVF